MSLYNRLILLALLALAAGSSAAAHRRSVLPSTTGISIRHATTTHRSTTTTRATPTGPPKANCVKHEAGSFHYFFLWGIEDWSYPNFTQLVSEFQTRTDKQNCDVLTFSSQANVPKYGSAMVFDVTPAHDGCIESVLKTLGAPDNVCPSDAVNPTDSWWQQADNVQSSNIPDLLDHVVDEKDGNQNGTPRATLYTGGFTSTLNSDTVEFWATATVSAGDHTTVTVPLGQPTETLAITDYPPSANCYLAKMKEAWGISSTEAGIFGITNISYWGSPVPSDGNLDDVSSALNTALKDISCTPWKVYPAENVSGFGPSIALLFYLSIGGADCLNKAIAAAGGPDSLCPSDSDNQFSHGIDATSTEGLLGSYLNEYNATGESDDTNAEYQHNGWAWVFSS